MCGICGFYDTEHRAAEDTLARMTDKLVHRGPDDSSSWRDDRTGIGLGHRRLSILDLSPLGRQPMHSACGRYVIAYNGEIYNHRELRVELGDYPFRSTSDTETILAAVSRWGLVPALRRFVGMFAFALWDRETRELHLTRDRLGIKPLYVARQGNSIVFGSELKALRGYPGFQSVVDRNALSLYFRHGYIPAPHSIYKNVSKLHPGTIASFSSPDQGPTVTTYWSAQEVWLEGARSPFVGSMEEAVSELDRLVRDAVKSRMLSDVPLGAFLSGGIDSSTVAAVMQAQSARPVKTFSIGFLEPRYNEAPHASRVAAHLGTEHTELIVTSRDLLDVIPDIPKYWDEPFADSSQVPTYVLSQMARDHVTVCLSGDGGDELFAGYARYMILDRWGCVERIPLPLRRLLSKGLAAAPNHLFRVLGEWGDKVRWRTDALAENDFTGFYRRMVSHSPSPVEFVFGSTEPDSALTDVANHIGGDRFFQMTFWDTVGYLPDDILTKVDRASMAVGLEARVPLLDHRVVAFAASLPTSMKVCEGKGKQVLRRVLDRYVPRELVERPKMGFGVPIQEWLGRELRDWCESLLCVDLIRSQGYIDADRVQSIWREYLRGSRHLNHQLWDILMFQAWLEEAKP